MEVVDMRSTTPPMDRRLKKQHTERLRRDRMNTALDELKTLILKALNKDESKYAKLEKADILEMTVNHIRHHFVEQARPQSQGLPPSPIKYEPAYTQCMEPMMVSRTPSPVDTTQVVNLPGSPPFPLVYPRAVMATPTPVAGVYQLVPSSPVNLSSSMGPVSASDNLPSSPVGAPGQAMVPDMNNNVAAVPNRNLIPSSRSGGKVMRAGSRQDRMWRPW